MIKENKWKIIITTLVVLLPMLAGIILWPKLPDRMPPPLERGRGAGRLVGEGARGVRDTRLFGGGAYSVRGLHEP